MDEKDYLNFKYLLEYFVSHLEWIVNNDISFIGYKKYVEPRLQKNEFKITGQGYNGGRIQEQILGWDHYEGTQVCINVTYNQMVGYQSKFCYLNWLWTGVNIIAEWEDKHIVGLYQEVFIEKKKPEKSIWKSLNMSTSIQELGLFDNSNTANSVLKSFYKNFRTELLQHNLRELHNKKMAQIEDNIKLLKYKKQIILQGPPGTGKTRKAKEISRKMISVNDEFFKKRIKVGMAVPTAKGQVSYKVISISDGNMVLEREKGTTNTVTLSSISSAFIGEKWKNEITNNDDRMAVAIAKYIYDDFFKDNEQVKIIQFHPSYTYEDFVRGIVAKPNPDGDGVLYETENKILGEFANRALDNYLLSKGVVNSSDGFEEKFNMLLTAVNDSVSQGNTFSFGDKSTAEIIYSTNRGFVYRFPKRLEIEYNLLFDDLRKVYERRNEIKIPIDLRDKEKAFGLEMKGKYPYYFMLLQQLEKFNIVSKKFEDEKPFVLIIDEINRANLSSVLGELIYALEYRGEEVESMYEVDGLRKLILPPNLYIIGTMNTADRSVGHIDYAIRRRFVFVDVLPKKLVNDEQIIFKDDIFKIVSELFIKNYDEYINDESVDLMPADTLFSDFKPQDVWLGHSYFIQKKDKDDKGEEVLIPEKFSTRIQYEIIPILEEYIKDGILKESARAVIKVLKTTADSA